MLTFRASDLTRLFTWLEPSTLNNLITHKIIIPHKNAKGRGSSRKYSLNNAFQIMVWKCLSDMHLSYDFMKKIIPSMKKPSDYNEIFTYRLEGISLNLKTGEISAELDALINNPTKKSKITEETQRTKNQAN